MTQTKTARPIEGFAPPRSTPVAPTQKDAGGQMESSPRSLHTPGPWKVYELPVGARHGYYEIRFRQSNIAVAKCPYSLVQLGFPKDQAKANARLIAAAPELLEACRSILATKFVREQAAILDHGIGTETGGGKAILSLRAALAKAEGRQ